MSVLADDIKVAIATEDDFGHEMRVGNIFNSVQHPDFFSEPTRVNPPAHGGTYIDKVTGKPRQFDFRCRVIRSRPSHQAVQIISIAAECKNLNPSFPLVICGRKRTWDESYHTIGRSIIGAVPDETEQIGKIEGMNSFYKPLVFVGKSLLRLKMKDKKLCSDGDSEIYDKWSQALASCDELSENLFEKIDFQPNRKVSAFILPLVVVPDNSLWCVSYGDNGKVERSPARIDKCEFYVEKKLRPIGMGLTITHIHFVTLSGLATMLSEFVAVRSGVWDTLFGESAIFYRKY